jgi:hypothetical protein
MGREVEEEERDLIISLLAVIEMMSRTILGTIKWFRDDSSLSYARSSPGTWPIILTFHYVHSLCG